MDAITPPKLSGNSIKSVKIYFQSPGKLNQTPFFPFPTPGMLLQFCTDIKNS